MTVNILRDELKVCNKLPRAQHYLEQQERIHLRTSLSYATAKLRRYFGMT